MSIDASRINLVNFYVDANQNLFNTDVYANGTMQALLFPVVNYDGDASAADVDAIKKYVYENIKIMEITSTGEKLFAWEKSNVDNGYLHDTARGVLLAEGEGKSTSNIRTPIYFTVPVGSAGKHQLYAKLGSISTSKTQPVTISASSFNIVTNDFSINDIASAGSGTKLRTLKAASQSLPSAYKLMKIEGKGVAYGKDHHWFNGYHAMMASSKGHKAGFFLDRDERAPILMIESGGHYLLDEYTLLFVNVSHSDIYPNHYVREIHAENGGWGHSQEFSQHDLDNAFSLGLPMIKVVGDTIKLRGYMYDESGDHYYYQDLLDFEIQGFIVHDNFGNTMKININWDAGDWWGKWAVSSVSIVYP